MFPRGTVFPLSGLTHRREENNKAIAEIGLRLKASCRSSAWSAETLWLDTVRRSHRTAGRNESCVTATLLDVLLHAGYCFISNLLQSVPTAHLARLMGNRVASLEPFHGRSPLSGTHKAQLPVMDKQRGPAPNLIRLHLFIPANGQMSRLGNDTWTVCVFFTKRLLCWTSVAVYLSLSLDPPPKKRSHVASLGRPQTILNKSRLCNSQLIGTDRHQAILELWATLKRLLSLIAFRRSHVNATFRNFIWLGFKLLEGQAVPA